MQLSNVDVRGEGVLLEPTLKEFVNKLALARPEWAFTFDYAKDKNYTVSKCMQNNSLAPNDTEYATRMVVTQGSRHLGIVAIQRNVSRDYSKKWCLTVFSENVRGGNPGTTKTANMTTAVRNAKTYLKCPSLGRVLYEKASVVQREYTSALYNLERNVSRGHLVPSWEGLQILINSFIRNQTPDAKLLTEFSAAVHNPKFEVALAEYMLAQHMKKLPQGTIPICLIDGLYAFFPDNSLLDSREKAENFEPQLVPFEALPLEWQNNLAVLQLMENNEVIKDVGYRVDGENFMIVR